MSCQTLAGSVEQLLVEAIDDVARFLFLDQEAEVVGTGAVTDHADVVLANGVKDLTAHPGRFAHPVADERHQRQPRLHLHLAQLAKLRQPCR